jgi:flagellar protein FlaG
VPPVQASPQAPSLRARAEEVQKAVDSLNASIEGDRSVSHTGVHFSMDNEADQLVVKVIDRETEVVVRQYPAEEVLDRIKLSQSFKGLLFDAHS